ncbi:MAG TPA: ComEA family DNA-binding protein [Candidatus Limnocylindrales bacterium]
MDESATPWRALESPTVTGPPSDPARSRRPLAFAGFAIAGVLAAGAFALAASGGGGSIVVPSRDPGTGTAQHREPAATGAPGSARLVVEVVGAVRKPGVYEFAPGSRVRDALAAAGGYGPRVDAGKADHDLNLAAPLRDGDQIRVASRDERGSPAAGGGGAGSGGTAPAIVDLNHATAAELDALPGVGPVTAAKIIAARDQQSFASVDDVKTRKIVGAATLEKIRALVSVR